MTGSRDVAKAAILMSLSKDRDEEKQLKNELLNENIHAAAVDFGGEFIASVTKLIERAIVAAKREGIIGETHLEEGGVAGAAHEALSQIMVKAIGLNVGGKIGMARHGDHITVCVFMGIGLLHLNEVAIGLGHRAI